MLRLTTQNCYACCVILGVLVTGMAAAIPESQPAETTFTDPVVLDLSQDTRRTPALLYYVVDSEDPFMQMAVDYEMQQLKSACRQGGPINWLAVINSAILKDRYVAFCKDGHYGNQRITDSGFERTFASVSAVGQGPANGTLKFPVSVTAENRPYLPLYAHYPMAHPDLFLKVLEMTKEAFFPADQYDLFVHAKAHGSNHLMMTGLTPETLARKVTNQTAFWTSVNSSEAPLPGFALGDAGRSEGITQPPKFLRQAGLGEALGQAGLDANPPGSTPSDSRSVPLVDGLGQFLMGIGNAQINNYFGIWPMSLQKVLAYLKAGQSADRSGSPLAFLLIESCDSSIYQSDEQASSLYGLMPLGGFYSATGSLWYRNIDWDIIFDAWKTDPSSAHMINILANWTKKIPNYHFPEIPVEQIKHP